MNDHKFSAGETGILMAIAGMVGLLIGFFVTMDPNKSQYGNLYAVQRDRVYVLEQTVKTMEKRIELWKQAYDDCNNSRTNIIETLKGMKP